MNRLAIVSVLVAVMCLAFGCAPETTIQADGGVQKQLDAKIAHVGLEDMGLEQVFEFIGETSGVNVHVRWPAMAVVGVKPTDTVTVQLSNTTARGILEDVLNTINGGNAKLGYVINEDVVTISTRSDVGDPTIVRVYDIRDILCPELESRSVTPRLDRSTDDAGLFDPGAGGGEADPDLHVRKIMTEKIAEIQTLIKNKVDSDSWRVESERNNVKQSGAISVLNGRLVITQTAENHEKIVELMGKVRYPKESPKERSNKDRNYSWSNYPIADVLQATTGFSQLSELKNDADCEKYSKGIDELRRYITGSVDRDSWGEGKGRVVQDPSNPQLRIYQTTENHNEIDQLMDYIRKENDLKEPKPLSEIPWHTLNTRNWHTTNTNRRQNISDRKIDTPTSAPSGGVEPKKAKDAGRIERLIERVRSQERRREFDSAIKTLKQLLILDPHNRWAHEHLELLQNFKHLRTQRGLINNPDLPGIYTGSIRRIPRNLSINYPNNWKELTDRRDTARAVEPPETKRLAEDKAIGAPSESEQE